MRKPHDKNTCKCAFCRNKIGKNNPFYGKHHTKETLVKQSLVKLGKKLTEEHKKKIGLKSLGHIVSKKAKKIIGLKNSISLIGYKHSESTKEKHRKRSKKLWKNEEYRRKICIGWKKSHLDKIIEKVINQYKLPYKYVGNGKIWIGKGIGRRMNPDFINTTGENKVIEVYGTVLKIMNFGSIENYELKRRKQFKKYGFSVVFINNKDIYRKNYKLHCLSLIKGGD